MDTDVVVVGAGVIGLAVARDLAGRGLETVVLERHERYGVETSSRNSEVVHAGMYYPTGSLKARLTVAGNRSLADYCAAREVPFQRLGKLIVATSTEEEAQLEEVLARGRANGVRRLEPISAQRARELEPHVRATSALFSPDTGIVDSHRLMGAMLAEATGHGCNFAWRHEVVAAERVSDGYALSVRDAKGGESEISAGAVVNSAGLEADRLAELVGLDLDECRYRLHYARGHYFRVHPRKRHLASHLIYPVPASGTRGLGIHVTLDLAGGMRLGPDVEYLERREQDYRVGEELREAFWRAASRYLDGLMPEDLAPDLAGIRPKLQGPGEEARDFVVAEESERGYPGWVNLIGIESPGLTCALEIARMVGEMIDSRPMHGPKTHDLA